MGTATATKQKNLRAASPKFMFREAGFSCYNVTPLPESLCSTLFAAVYKRTPEGGKGALSWLFCFGGFFWVFGLILLLWAFWCGKLFWKGNELLRGNC
jgi:hypothetical protein